MAEKNSDSYAKPDFPEPVFIGGVLHKLDMLIGRDLERQRPIWDNEGVKDVVTGGNGRILHYLEVHANEEICQRDIERAFGMTRSAVSRILELMERKGLIERVSVSRDKRLKQLVITEKAVALSRQMHESARRTETCMEKGFTQQEKELFLSMMRRMIKNFEDENHCTQTGGTETNA